jgi:hypothetical protein
MNQSVKQGPVCKGGINKGSKGKKTGLKYSAGIRFIQWPVLIGFTVYTIKNVFHDNDG